MTDPETYGATEPEPVSRLRDILLVIGLGLVVLGLVFLVVGLRSAHELDPEFEVAASVIAAVFAVWVMVKVHRDWSRRLRVAARLHEPVHVRSVAETAVRWVPLHAAFAVLVPFWGRAGALLTAALVLPIGIGFLVQLPWLERLEEELRADVVTPMRLGDRSVSYYLGPRQRTPYSNL